ncbi:SDR family oxidoreductase [Lysinibacter cavernae]|uniref:NAD(P)-dependent dehydrogenase (Short-subunit alcohol dehydrogenase family) n=1 Tax=Lysinibacter cavernae TaxID=1640652 RepID=A0A7X5R3V4_9MICO|nr:SDR family oxidoreductase [Lysinibacter cavernae]NIH55126.1 NAD(P)-dependent dehydrogenase (short-subunit alcohol dehydrogenase family) [Lysinibacter cavernae]
MTKDLAGHVAVVTGGARGLGYSIASALARRGVDVGLLDLLPTVSESAESLAGDLGVRAAGRVVDVTDADAVEAAFADLEAELGQPTLLVTAAGITIWGASETVEPAVWQKVIDVNLSGTFFAAQAFGRRCLDTNRNGSAIFVSSMSGFIVNQPQFQASYSASKAAVAHLAKSLAVEWATRGIRVNAIAPGYFLSDMTREFTDSNPDLAEQWTSSIPMGRMGEPGDLDGLVGFLASADSAYITGQTITIDGGYTSL